MTSGIEKWLIILFLWLTIPAHALLIAYFLNERMFRVKKRAFFDWLREKGIIENEEWGRRKKF